MDGFKGKEVWKLQPNEPLGASLSSHRTELYVGTHTLAYHPHMFSDLAGIPFSLFSYLIIVLLTRKCKSNPVVLGKENAGLKQRHHIWSFYTCVLGT